MTLEMIRILARDPKFDCYVFFKFGDEFYRVSALTVNIFGHLVIFQKPYLSEHCISTLSKTK